MITIAVPTYRRQQELDVLLGVLLEHADQLESDRPLRILVIDNDAELSAAEIVDVRCDHRLHYVHEPRPGVAAVRNRALQEAWQDEVVIFIDDDQLPAPGWLSSLLARWREGADAVAGPVVSELPTGVDRWVAEGGFFDRRYRDSLPSGARIDEVATTNLLLDMAAVRSRQLSFDERFGLSGGEDSLFTRSLTRTGGTIVWDRGARVIERVPVHRATRSWVCRRAISSGNGAARVQLALEPTATARIRSQAALLGSGLVRCAAGGVGIATGLVRRSTGQQGRSTRTLLRGFGMCLGAVGISYLEYARDGRHWELTAVG